jgi:glycosyltransferase involved in cell wall biosynthesis
MNQYKVAYLKIIKIHYIAISKQIKRHWIERGLDSDMIEVIHNMSQSFEDCEADDKDTALITEYNGHKLIFVGRLIACKGISFLIKSFKMLLNSGIHAKLYLLGSGEEENSLRDLICNQEIEENVVFLGYRSNPLAIMRKMDLLILPSKEEGFGRVLLEAMGVGVAVIGTKVGGIPEIIDNEVNGLLVPYGDVLALKEAILRVLNDGTLKRRIINAGFCTLQSRFNKEHYSKRLENVYDSFLN